MKRNQLAVTPETFWDTDLDVIESTFLSKNVKITDLPTSKINGATPAQGSVLLNNIVNIDKCIPTSTSLFSRLKNLF